MRFLLSSRQTLLRRALAAVTAALTTTSGPPILPMARPQRAFAEVGAKDQTVLPLRPFRGSFVAAFEVDGQRIRAVVDTGSPFLLVDGSCSAIAGGSFWGCYDAQRSAPQGELARARPAFFLVY